MNHDPSPNLMVGNTTHVEHMQRVNSCFLRQHTFWVCFIGLLTFPNAHPTYIWIKINFQNFKEDGDL